MTGVIKETKLKEAIKWLMTMKGWEFTTQSLRKTEAYEKILQDFIDGEIRLGSAK